MDYEDPLGHSLSAATTQLVNPEDTQILTRLVTEMASLRPIFRVLHLIEEHGSSSQVIVFCSTKAECIGAAEKVLQGKEQFLVRSAGGLTSPFEVDFGQGFATKKQARQDAVQRALQAGLLECVHSRARVSGTATMQEKDVRMNSKVTHNRSPSQSETSNRT